MPLYEYVCEECEERFEELRSQSAADEGVTCATCGSGNVSRQFSSFATGSAGSGSGVTAGGSCGPRGFS